MDRIVGKALAKDHDERYQHADDLLVDLQAVRRELEPQAASRVSAKPATAKRTSPMIFGALAAIVLVALGVGWWFGNSSEPAMDAPPLSP